MSQHEDSHANTVGDNVVCGHQVGVDIVLNDRQRRSESERDSIGLGRGTDRLT